MDNIQLLKEDIDTVCDQMLLSLSTQIQSLTQTEYELAGKLNTILTDNTVVKRLRDLGRGQEPIQTDEEFQYIRDLSREYYDVLRQKRDIWTPYLNNVQYIKDKIGSFTVGASGGKGKTRGRIRRGRRRRRRRTTRKK